MKKEKTCMEDLFAVVVNALRAMGQSNIESQYDAAKPKHYASVDIADFINSRKLMGDKVVDPRSVGMIISKNKERTIAAITRTLDYMYINKPGKTAKTTYYVLHE